MEAEFCKADSTVSIGVNALSAIWHEHVTDEPGDRELRRFHIQRSRCVPYVPPELPQEIAPLPFEGAVKSRADGALTAHPHLCAGPHLAKSETSLRISRFIMRQLGAQIFLEETFRRCH
ncbi:hypothetical protein ACFY5D_00515 [Paeniglutamicibacter sp. NPDC012692]|uniref:hypothetical protein n=1 Tax=Paeniglutamicibacter sp. NPDC012692 TaxID=3364388 RepID=UPI0036A53B32